MEQLQPQFNHQTPLQIRFNDIDGLGHVNNSIYGCYFDLGRMRYFEDVYKKVIDWNNPGLIIKKTEILFEKPTYIDDTICVKSKVIRFGNKSFEMVQVIEDLKNGEIKAQCNTILVGFDAHTNHSTEIPDDFRQVLTEFEGLNR